MLTIGELARRSGVKVPTIRYYEQSGLLEKAERSEGNQRRYGRADLERLTFIRHTRELGFSLDAIRQLLALDDASDADSHAAEAIASAQLVQTRERIARLQLLERELTRIAAACEGGDQLHCRVIGALADHDTCASDHPSETAVLPVRIAPQRRNRNGVTRPRS